MNTTHRPDVVTYRLNDKMVYVTPAQSYEVSNSSGTVWTRS
jgi:hypothetical protein